MSIRSPDIKADYLKHENIELVRGDTFTLFVRTTKNGDAIVLPETAIISFAIFGVGRIVIIKKSFDYSKQDESGYIPILLRPSETALLSPALQYTYEVEYYINSAMVYTVLTGDIKVIADKITPDVRGV